MGVWGYIGLAALAAAVFIIGMALLSNLLTAWIAKRYSERIMKTKEKALTKLLPGTNCGKCGYPSCEAYAQAVFFQQADSDLCVQGGEALPDKIGAFMEEFHQLRKKKEEKQPLDSASGRMHE